LRYQIRNPQSEIRNPQSSHDRWVINKLRALGSYYTKGLDNGSHLRIAINTAQSLPQLQALIADFFGVPAHVESLPPSR